MNKTIQLYRNKMLALNQRRQENFENTIIELEQVFKRINAAPKTSLKDARRAAHLMIVSGTYTLDLYLIIIFMSAYSITSGAIMIPQEGYGVLKPVFVLMFLVVAVFIPIVTSRSTYIISLMMRIPLWQSRAVVVVITSLLVSYISVWMSIMVWDAKVIPFFKVLPAMFVLYSTAQFMLHLRLSEYLCFIRYQKRHASSNIESLLPPSKRGKLLAMSARDHYVKILTDRGAHLQRLSMKEAVALTPEHSGLLVHRSHWVAYAAIESFKTTADKHHIILRTGDLIPVARAKATQVKNYLDGTKQDNS